MSVVSAGVSLARFAAGVPGFVRKGLGADDSRRALREDLGRREENFLRSARATIFGNPRSPYAPLLQAAGCEQGDLEDSVRRIGLEPTLTRLRGEGVYVTFEEFKGRAPVIRNGRQLDVRPDDFANPLARGAVRPMSGGSTGPPAHTVWSLPHLATQAVGRAVGYAAHGVVGVPSAVWRQVLPSPSGVLQMLTDARFGQRYERWFAPSSPFAFPSSIPYRTATETILAAARLGGALLPRPERADYDEPDVVARWACKRAQSADRVLIRTGISQAVRVATAAAERGWDLSGVVFVGAGEPPTPAKARAVGASGAVHVPTYVSSEIGHMGIGCANPDSTNDVHVFEHAYAIVQHERAVGDSAVGAFLVTSLLATGPTIALNLETDDFGVLESRACGCPLGELGLLSHVRDVYSFSKLTGEGVTLVGTDLVRVLEEELPARYGGTLLDYQLVEEEDELGNTKLGLVISPRVAISDESEVVRTLLAGLGETSHSKEARYIWQRRGTVVVRRREPVATMRGKHQPLVRRVAT